MVQTKSLYEGNTVTLCSRVNKPVRVTLVYYIIRGVGKLFLDTLLGLSDLRKLAAGNYDTVFVNDTEGASHCVLYLMDDGLK